MRDKKQITPEECDLLMWLIVDALHQGQLAKDSDNSEFSERDQELMETMGFENEEDYLAWRDESLNSDKGLNTLVEDFDYTGVDFDAARSDSGLLELIRKHESGGNYDISWGGKEPIINGKHLTECTINEVLDWQESCGKASTAVGAYQFINKTLAGLTNRLGLTGNEVFNEALQDRLATELANRRGLDQFLKGEMSEQKLITNLSKEWAAIPKDASGLSYYHGDGLNKANVSYASIAGAVRNEFEANKTSMGVDEQLKPDHPSPGFTFDPYSSIS